MNQPLEVLEGMFVNGLWEGPENTFLGGLARTEWVIPRYMLTFSHDAPRVVNLTSLTMLGDLSTENALHLGITVEPGVSVILIERHAFETPKAERSGRGPSVTRIVDLDITLLPGSRLTHGVVIGASPRGRHLAATRVRVTEGALYDRSVFLGGGKVVRDDLEVTLEGPRAEARVRGLARLTGAEHAEARAHVVHAVPRGTSRQLYKYVLDDQAQGAFHGKITVKSGAVKSDGQQVGKALVLSDRAQMDAQPELIIHADDVVCSHGMAIGDVSADEVFYLRSRGIPESEARGLLVRGFLAEVLDAIPSPEVRAAFEEEMAR